MRSATDPRFNAPPRLSDLHGDARRAALVARDEESRRRYMAGYQNAAEAPCSGGPWSALRRMTRWDVVAVTLFVAAFVAMVLA